MPVELSDENFDQEVLKAELPVLVDFWAPWCGPCRVAEPVLEKIADEYKGKLKTCKLNVDEGRQTAAKYQIMSIPTLVIFKGGKAVGEIVGVSPNYEADIKAKLQPHIK